MIPSRTIDVQASYGLHLISSQELVDWATDAIVFGCDSRNLRLLVGLQSPFDSDEVKRLFKVALKELQIEELPAERYVPTYITSILKAMLNREIPRNEALRCLADLYTQQNLDRQLQDFSNLYYAKWDLECYNEQYYWRGAKHSNIDKIIDKYAMNWLNEHAIKKNS
ncbi:MAG TPA: hypothetical protein VHC44_02680 [Verrucomicrobiae bacterium]|nr:hypothetical protein [Verrucomicrobiae bacterium]